MLAGQQNFTEIPDPFKDMRADWSDQPGLRNQWRIAAGLDGLARSRFETLAKLAGRSLLVSTYAIGKCSTDLRAIQDDMARWLAGVRELTGRFQFGPVGTLLDSNEKRVGTLLTGSIDRVIDASALLCLQLAAEETETRSSSSDRDGDENINITVIQGAKEIKNTVGSNMHADTKMPSRSFFMNPWVVGIGVTVIGGILLYIITATIPKQKTIIEKTPEQRIEKYEDARPLKLPTLVIIVSDEIVLSGPGSYLVDTENKATSDAISKIYGLSEGDEVTLRAADNNRTIVVTKGHYLIMPANFSLNNEDDFIVLKSKGSDICAEVHRQNNGD
jgi:hypothetical protein